MNLTSRPKLGFSRAGNPAGSTAVPTSTAVALQRKVSGGWRVQNSFSGCVAFHKTSGQVDFIYRVLPPP